MEARLAIAFGLALALSIVTLPPAAASPVPEAPPGCALDDCVDVSLREDTSGWIAVSGSGDAEGGQLGASGSGDAQGLMAISGSDEANAQTLALSSSEDASGIFALSGTGSANGTLLGASGSDDADGHIALTGTGTASGCQGPAWIECANVSMQRTAESALPK